MPSDFQLYRKMKHKFYFRFSFFVFLCSKKTKLDCHFRFSFFPRREGNGIRIHFMFSNPCTLVPTDFQLCRRRNSNFIFVFRFSVEFWKRITIRFWFFLFSVYGIETDNLCWGGHGEFWIPQHRKQNRTNTASPQEILSTHRHRKIYLV